MRIGFVLGLAIGWLLVRRKPEPTEFERALKQAQRATDKYAVVLDELHDGSVEWGVVYVAEPPSTRYAVLLRDNYMHMGWMQADGTWTWS